MLTDLGALCRKVNEALCGSVLPGKFVTLFYGVIDSDTLALRLRMQGIARRLFYGAIR